MKTLLSLACLVLLTGCINMSGSRVLPDGTRVTFNATSLFSNSAIRTLGVDTTTKTTSNLIKMSGAVTEPNAESITASSDALGNLIGKAAQSMVKP